VEERKRSLEMSMYTGLWSDSYTASYGRAPELVMCCCTLLVTKTWSIVCVPLLVDGRLPQSTGWRPVVCKKGSNLECGCKPSLASMQRMTSWCAVVRARIALLRSSRHWRRGSGVFTVVESLAMVAA